jgi:2'-phosphotransferase
VHVNPILKGTYKDCWKSIYETGLNKMSRNHIHMAKGYFKEVLSGMRASCDIFIEIDL